MTSRFSVVDVPVLEPGHCWVSRTTDGPFIDTGIDIGRMHIERGRLYLSFDVLREMAREAGIIDEGKSVSAELKEKEWYDKGYSDALKENYGNLLNRLADSVNSGIVDALDSAIDTEPKAVEATAGGTHETDEASGKPERKSTSTGSVKRPSRISADTGDESAYRL